MNLIRTHQIGRVTVDSGVTHVLDGSRAVELHWDIDGRVDEYRTFGRLID